MARYLGSMRIKRISQLSKSHQVVTLNLYELEGKYFRDFDRIENHTDLEAALKTKTVYHESRTDMIDEVELVCHVQGAQILRIDRANEAIL